LPSPVTQQTSEADACQSIRGIHMFVLKNLKKIGRNLTVPLALPTQPLTRATAPLTAGRNTHQQPYATARSPPRQKPAVLGAQWAQSAKQGPKGRQPQVGRPIWPNLTAAPLDSSEGGDAAFEKALK